jgi:hypothetical protein
MSLDILGQRAKDFVTSDVGRDRQCVEPRLFADQGKNSLYGVRRS